MENIKLALEKAELAIAFYQKRLNEQGFYSPNRQPEVLEALEAIKAAKEELSNSYQDPTPKEIYHLILKGGTDGGWQGFALSVSNFLKQKWSIRK